MPLRIEVFITFTTSVDYIKTLMENARTARTHSFQIVVLLIFFATGKFYRIQKVFSELDLKVYTCTVRISMLYCEILLAPHSPSVRFSGFPSINRAVIFQYLFCI